MDKSEKLATLGTQDEEKKQKHNRICVEHHYAQTNSNTVNKTWALLQTTGGKDENQYNYIQKLGTLWTRISNISTRITICTSNFSIELMWV